MNKRDRMLERIKGHGENVIVMFDLPRDANPFALCRMLRRIEADAYKIGLRMCNGPEFGEGEAEAAEEKVMARLRRLLGKRLDKVPVFLNKDPRGYCLKIDDEWMREWHERRPGKPRLHCDWGGYGILAPDLTND